MTTSKLLIRVAAGFALALLPFIAFDRKRRREPWGKTTICLVAGIGIAQLIAVFLRDFHIIEMSPILAWTFEYMLTLNRGFILGLIAALLLSGELLGKPAK